MSKTIQIKKGCECGSQRVNADRLIRVEIIVDENNMFVENIAGGDAVSIVDDKPPEGPYTCVECECEYDTLDGE